MPTQSSRVTITSGIIAVYDTIDPLSHQKYTRYIYIYIYVTTSRWVMSLNSITIALNKITLFRKNITQLRSLYSRAVQLSIKSALKHWRYWLRAIDQYLLGNSTLSNFDQELLLLVWQVWIILLTFRKQILRFVTLPIVL